MHSFVHPRTVPFFQYVLFLCCSTFLLIYSRFSHCLLLDRDLVHCFIFLIFFYYEKTLIFERLVVCLFPKGGQSFDKGAPSSVRQWKEQFFFVPYSSVKDWRLPHWGRPRDCVFGVPRLEREDSDGMKALREYRVLPLR